MALRLGSVHIRKWAQTGSLPRHMGTKSFLPFASRIRRNLHQSSRHPLPESKEGQGWHGLTFRFCTGIAHLLPSLFQLGQEAVNHKHFHAQSTPVLVGPSIQQFRVPHPPHPTQFSRKTWPWLYISMVSWLLFFQTDIFLDVGIKVC